MNTLSGCLFSMCRCRNRPLETKSQCGHWPVAQKLTKLTNIFCNTLINSLTLSISRLGLGFPIVPEFDVCPQPGLGGDLAGAVRTEDVARPVTGGQVLVQRASLGRCEVALGTPENGQHKYNC